jgi:hypothetical protein
MYNKDYRDPNRLGAGPFETNELTSARGNGVYYTLAALLVIVLAVGGLIFAGGGVPHPELATAPDRSHPVTMPATPPVAPRLPSATPDAPPGAPTMTPAPAIPKE